jgi:REP element-mobilizing transposase RayT
MLRVGGRTNRWESRTRDPRIRRWIYSLWVTKYRYKILRGDIAERARDLLRQICAARELTIIRGAVSPDHIHMLLAAPPQLSPSKLVPFLKGRSSRLLQQEFPALRKRYWGQHLWARGYYCARRNSQVVESEWRRILAP